MDALCFDSTDIGRTEEFLSRAYTKMSIGGQAERTRAKISRRNFGSLSVDKLSIDYDMSHNAPEPIGKFCLCKVHSGSIVRQFYPEGVEGTFGSGDVFLYTPHDRPYSGVIQGAEYELLMVDPRLLDEVAGSGERPVRLTGDRPVSPLAATQLWTTVSYLHDEVMADPVAAAAPLIVSTASQLMVASVLNAFPHNVVTEPTPEDSHDAHPATVRRAVAFIEANLAEPMTLADIAGASGTTGRAVQAAFRRHYGCTPMDYLRRVRLDAAHQDLRAADPMRGDTVAGIAARWGFGPSARFTRAYREQYGVPPSSTLRA